MAERSDELTWKSLRNLTAVHLLEPGQLNTYDVLLSDDIVFTQAALEAFLAGPATGKSAKAVATSTEVDGRGSMTRPMRSRASTTPRRDRRRTRLTPTTSRSTQAEVEQDEEDA